MDLGISLSKNWNCCAQNSSRGVFLLFTQLHKSDQPEVVFCSDKSLLQELSVKCYLILPK